MKLNLVPARTGIQWVKLGVQTFLRQPLAMAGLFFMYVAVVLVIVGLLTVLGTPALLAQAVAGMIGPAATLGFMAATAETATGRFPMPTVLLSAFRAGRQRARAMLLLGALYAASSLLATAAGDLLGGPPPAPTSGDTRPSVDAGGVIGLMLHLPIVVLFWHAPALVHWHGVPPVKSLFFSAVVCWRNKGAFLMFGATWVALLMLLLFTLGTMALLTGGVGMMQVLALPLMLLTAVMILCSTYFTFRDCFVASPPEEIPHE